MLENLLVAIDGSEYSKKALEFAVELADKFSARLLLVHAPQGVAADRVMVLGGASMMIHANHEQIEEAGRELVEAARKLAEERLPGGRVSTELRGGDPAAEIVAAAEENEVDCIIIGSRGLGDFGGMLLGSVSHKVNHTAPCTCITVH
ncbi:MAG: universal stress protein [Woeseiaceae bacterium]|jgi:nucleotide-binding universal stress UspA family protein|nr:universal stress protein [Woeseiaceae bacterium]